MSPVQQAAWETVHAFANAVCLCIVIAVLVPTVVALLNLRRD